MSTENPSPFDYASFYVEQVKYGPGDRETEVVDEGEVAAQLEVMMRDANINSMTGQELSDTIISYGKQLYGHMAEHRARGNDLSVLSVVISAFLDGLMHGMAFGAGLRADTPHAEKP